MTDRAGPMGMFEPPEQWERFERRLNVVRRPNVAMASIVELTRLWTQINDDLESGAQVVEVVVILERRIN